MLPELRNGPVSSIGMRMIVPRRLQFVDLAITEWMAHFGTVLLRVSLGIVFLWFGVLKFFPNVSPAEGLATHTIGVLSGGVVSPTVALPLLAAWECLIGIGLLLGRGLRGILLLLYVQMLGTLTPIILFPHDVFVRIPYAPTLEGQVHHQESSVDQRRHRNRSHSTWRTDCAGAPRRRSTSPAGIHSQALAPHFDGVKVREVRFRGSRDRARRTYVTRTVRDRSM